MDMHHTLSHFPPTADMEELRTQIRRSQSISSPPQANASLTLFPAKRVVGFSDIPIHLRVPWKPILRLLGPNRANHASPTAYLDGLSPRVYSVSPSFLFFFWVTLGARIGISDPQSGRPVGPSEWRVARCRQAARRIFPIGADHRLSASAHAERLGELLPCLPPPLPPSSYVPTSTY